MTKKKMQERIAHLEREVDGYRRLAKEASDTNGKTVVVLEWCGTEMRVFGETPQREKAFAEILAKYMTDTAIVPAFIRVTEAARHRQALLGANRKRPDAFLIDCDQQLVTLFEVVETSHCDPRDYAMLWFYLDCEEWGLRIEIRSHIGGTMAVSGNDELVSLYYDKALADGRAGGVAS